MTNEVALSGELTAIEPLRYTPAGIPLLNFRLLHRSQQAEAGLKRQVECEVNGVAMAEVAVALSRLKPGQAARVKGFLNRKNRMSAQLVFHATEAYALKE
ncbi:MAG: primosomal replication protein N [Burkholderiales bacterium]